MSFILPTLLSMSNLPHIILIFAQTSLQFVMVLWCCLKCELTDPAGGLREATSKPNASTIRELDEYVHKICTRGLGMELNF
jgi:hypothetical protein